MIAFPPEPLHDRQAGDTSPGAAGPPVAYRAGHPLIPDSHPLDFDWRFDEATIATLHARVPSQNVLLLGVPTVARRIDASGGRALLVDRQPVQCVRHHLATEVAAVTLADGEFDAAIADPPWYPGQLVEWAEVAARAVRPGGEVLVSVWPRETRPGAESELAQCLGVLGSWADISAEPIELRYDTPPFERVAGYVSQSVGQTRSPRRGLLLRLVARERPAPPAMKPTAPRWHRFLFDRYQLAVRSARASRVTASSSGIPRRSTGSDHT